METLDIQSSSESASKWYGVVRGVGRRAQGYGSQAYSIRFTSESFEGLGA